MASVVFNNSRLEVQKGDSYVVESTFKENPTVPLKILNYGASLFTVVLGNDATLTHLSDKKFTDVSSAISNVSGMLAITSIVVNLTGIVKAFNDGDKLAGTKCVFGIVIGNLAFALSIISLIGVASVVGPVAMCALKVSLISSAIVNDFMQIYSAISDLTKLEMPDDMSISAYKTILRHKKLDLLLKSLNLISNIASLLIVTSVISVGFAAIPMISLTSAITVLFFICIFCETLSNNEKRDYESNIVSQEIQIFDRMRSADPALYKWCERQEYLSRLNSQLSGPYAA